MGKYIIIPNGLINNIFQRGWAQPPAIPYHFGMFSGPFQRASEPAGRQRGVLGTRDARRHSQRGHDLAMPGPLVARAVHIP